MAREWHVSNYAHIGNNGGCIAMAHIECLKEAMEHWQTGEFDLVGVTVCRDDMNNVVVTMVTFMGREDTDEACACAVGRAASGAPGFRAAAEAPAIRVTYPADAGSRLP